MNVSPVSVAVIDKKTITKAEVLRAGQDGKTAKIQAITNGKYLLTQGNDGVAPENITVKRVGKNLLVMLEGSNAGEPDLIIEDFFSKSGSLVGKAEDGAMHEYVATDGDSDHDAAALADGETSALALGEGTIDTDSGFALASGFEWSPALIALGGLAAIAAAAGLGYLAAKEKYQDDNNGNTTRGGNGESGESGGDNGGRDVRVPVVGSLIDDVGSITGPIAKGGRTDDTQPTLNGTGSKGNVIEIWDGSAKIGETTVDENGNWSFTPGTPLAAGDHSITTRERNEKGVVSAPSDPWDFVIDLTAPAKGTIGSVIDDTVMPGKELTNGGLTKDNTPVLSGKAEKDSTVEVWKDGQLVGTAKADSEGNWTFTSPVLADGKHDFSIVVVDQVGNKSLPSDPWIVDVDTVPPENNGIGKIIDDDGKVIENGDETEDSTPTLEGVGQKGEIIKIIDNGKIIGSTVVDDKGEWTFTPEKGIDNGEHEFQIIVTDPAGNESAPSDKVIIEINHPIEPVDPGEEVIPDPNVPVTGTIEGIFKDNNEAGNKVPIAPGDPVNDPTLIVEGTGIAGNIVYLWITGANGHTYHSTTVGTDGKWSYTTPELADDIYNIEAAFKSADGVVTAKTPIYEIEVDTEAPAPPDIELFTNSLNGMDLSELLSKGSVSLFSEQQEENAELHDLKNALLDDISFNSSSRNITSTGVLMANDITNNTAFEMNELLDQTSHN
ncbi:Ig-like domain-containing protein [Pantoea sp.]|uniref:Ig-like domain-containing protein n=1 Tax=Pantoea sp. TaxID=69393 RepID=UPI0031DFCA1B